MKLLENKNALVTGSSRGIGREIAKRFLEEGASVWGICTKPSGAKAELEKIAKENGVSFFEIYANLINADEAKSVASEALKNAGGFDVLVNNAGITRDNLSFRMKKSDWDDVLAVNLTGTFVISQVVSAAMIRAKRGSIINMASIVGLHGQGGQVNYAASKAGIIGFSKSLAKEVGARGVRVNVIAPGFIETEMTGAIKADAKASWLESIPLKRAGVPIDVANAAVFLASDFSAYITAQVLGVDGGMGA